VRGDENSPKQSVFDDSMSMLSGSGLQGVSFSGNERNSLFLSLGGQGFEEISGISGFDDPADGRALGLFDYDRDGWLDLAIVNANAPMVQLFRNGTEDLVGKRSIVAFRFAGGNRAAASSETYSSRDGYGAKIQIDVVGKPIVREHRAGEGFASQNSATMLVGLGEGVEGGSARVSWPSGRVQELGFVPAGSLITVYEDARASPGGAGFVLAPYHVDGLAAGAKAAPRQERAPSRLALAGPAGRGNTKSKIKVVTTMATWCKACKGELPQIKLLREEFSEDELELLGVPVDETDTEEKLRQYVESNRPAYEMLDDLSDAEERVVKQAVIDELRVDALPAAIITDTEGRILRTLTEAPSVSEIRELLSREDA
jgi:thiol-disulfide isomerase/thioredoxin